MPVLVRMAVIAAGIGWLTSPQLCRGMQVVEVAPGVFRGPAPECAADYRQLRDLGVRTVLDLRKFRRRQIGQTCRCARAYGMGYVNAPVSFRPERDGSAERALRLLADARRHPVYIHCELGRDRSGLIVGLYRVRCQGWSPCAAYAEMQRFGFNERLRGLDQYFWQYARRRGNLRTDHVDRRPLKMA